MIEQLKQKVEFTIMADNQQLLTNYGDDAIQILEGLEAVRKRPGMYIGSTGYDGLHHLIKEIADNSIDEAIAGYGTKVIVRILDDGGINITDDGRGIPVDIHPKTGKRRYSNRIWRHYYDCSYTFAKYGSDVIPNIESPC